MKTYSLFTVLAIFLLFFNGCFGLRSAEGLKEGELNLGYIAPAGGYIRYGLSDHIESRFMMIVESYHFDLYAHTNTTDSSFNYGIMVGLNTLDAKVFNRYAGITIGKKINTYMSPYLSLIAFSESNKKISNYLAFGSEIKITVSEKHKLQIITTPEICYIQPSIKDDLFHSSFFGTINIGIALNF